MHDFTVLVLDKAYAPSVSLTLGILEAARQLSLEIGAPTPRWRVYGASGPQVALSSGLSLTAQALPERVRADRSIWVVPGLGLGTEEAVRARFQQPDAVKAAAALRAHAQRGGTVAASCAAVFLLQLAGLLPGKRVTTSWWLAPILQELSPDTHVDAQRLVVHDGEVITAGAALAQTDLMLHLLRHRFGDALADVVSRFMLIDERTAQSLHSTPALMANGHAVIARLRARIESSLPSPPPMPQLAAELGMSVRTLSRHVRAATGNTPMALLQHVRLSKARRLLESSRSSIEQVAAEVGYGDPTALRRLIRKQLGTTPLQLRRSAHED